MGADAQQALAAAVFFDQRAHIEPRPAADQNAHVAIVATSLRRCRCVPTARDCRSQSVSCVRARVRSIVHSSLQKRSSVTLPQSSSSARHASRSDGRGPRLVCGSADRQRHFRRRQHAADLSDACARTAGGSAGRRPWRGTTAGCRSANRRRTGTSRRRSSASVAAMPTRPAPSSIAAAQLMRRRSRRPRRRPARARSTAPAT